MRSAEGTARAQPQPWPLTLIPFCFLPELTNESWYLAPAAEVLRARPQLEAQSTAVSRQEQLGGAVSISKQPCCSRGKEQLRQQAATRP